MPNPIIYMGHLICRNKIIWLFFLFFLILAPGLVQAQETSNQYIDDSVIVKYKESPVLLETKAKERSNREASLFGKLQNVGDNIALSISGNTAPEQQLQQIDNISAQVGAEKVDATDEIGHDVFVLDTDGKKSVNDVVNFLNNQSQVEYAEPNYIYSLLATPNDTHYSKMWALTKIKASEGWDQTTGSKSIIAAVLDSGIEQTHEDLKDNITVAKDFTGCGMTDSVGHGTHTAGTVGAVGNNGKGVTGINWTVGIMALKVGCSGKDISLATVTSAINYAVDNGARVMNMSFGGSGSSQAMADAIKNAVNKNVVVVVAAGNSSGNNADSLYPASDPNVITVSATGPQDELARYSSYGTSVDISAPGGNPVSGSSSCTDTTCIASTWPGGRYNLLTGTSMAAPHVAGLAALILSKNPGLTSTQVRQIIESSAVDLGTSGKDIKFGAGRIDVKAALDLVTAGGTLPPLPTSSALPSPTRPQPTSIGDSDAILKVLPSQINTLKKSFVVGVDIDPGSNQILSTDIRINYDPDYLDIVGIDEGNYFPSLPRKVWDSTKGIIYIAGIVEKPKDYKTGSGTVATIRVNARKTGTTKLTIICKPNETAQDSNITKDSVNAEDIINCSKNVDSVINIDGLTPVPTIDSSKDRGDYDDDGTITYNDFVKWKDDFVQTLSRLRYFESWRKIYFSINRSL